MNNSNLALKLVDGTKADRDRYINRVDVLDKVRKLLTLPDGYIESKKVAKYYDVSPQTIRMIVKNRADEFKDGEMIKYSSKSLLDYKEKLKSKGLTLKATNHLNVFSRKGVLRIGMLLTNSSVAVKIRDYLLTVEEFTNQEQKQNALKYNGVWTNEIETYVITNINKKKNKGLTVTNAITEVAKEIDATRSLINARWYGTGGYSEKPLRKICDNAHFSYSYNGEWEPLLDDYTRNEIIKDITNGKTLQEAFERMADELGTTKSIVQNRWYDSKDGLRKNVDENILKQITANSNTAKIVVLPNNKKHNENVQFEKHITNQNKLIMDLLHEVKILQTSNENLHSDMAKLWRGYKEVGEINNELNKNMINEITKIKQDIAQIKQYIDCSIEEKINVLEKNIKNKSKKIKDQQQEIAKVKMKIADVVLGDDETKPKQQSFKMDKNGNLTKMD